MTQRSPVPQLNSWMWTEELRGTYQHLSYDKKHTACGRELANTHNGVDEHCPECKKKEALLKKEKRKK